MRLWALFAALLFVPILGCRRTEHRSLTPPPGAQDARRPDTDRYENVRYSFAVRLPSSWSYAESENGDGISILIPDLPGVRLSVYGSLNSWSVKDVDGLVRLYEELDSVPHLSATRIRRGGIPGIEFVEQRQGSSLARRLLLHGDTIYGLSLEAPPQEWPQALQVFEQLSNTFEARG